MALWGAVIFIGALLVFLAAAMFPQVTEKIVDCFDRPALVPDTLARTGATCIACAS